METRIKSEWGAFQAGFCRSFSQTAWELRLNTVPSMLHPLNRPSSLILTTWSNRKAKTLQFMKFWWPLKSRGFGVWTAQAARLTRFVYFRSMMRNYGFHDGRSTSKGWKFIAAQLNVPSQNAFALIHTTEFYVMNTLGGLHVIKLRRLPARQRENYWAGCTCTIRSGRPSVIKLFVVVSD